MSLRNRLESLHQISPLAGWTGTTTLVGAPPPPSRDRIALYAGLFSAGTVTSFYFADTTGTPISGTFSVLADSVWMLEQNMNTDPWFITAPTTGLQLAIVSGGPLTGDIYYLQVPGNI
jgi:hypothetical protein